MKAGCRLLEPLDVEGQPVDGAHTHPVAVGGTVCLPQLTVDANPAVVGHLAHEADESLRANSRAPAMGPAPPEPGLAELDRAAADDGNPPPRSVEDEEREQDADEKCQ